MYTIDTKEVLHREQMLETLHKEHGFVVELLIDAWEDDECVKEPSYRIFVWRIGHPKPHHNDDLGCYPERGQAYDAAIDYILNNLI
jgi:hypothetical protein